MAAVTDALLRFVGQKVDSRKAAVLSRSKFFERAAEGAALSVTGLASAEVFKLPMLQGDFSLQVDGTGIDLSESNYLIGISGGTSSGLSWSPHGSVLGVPMPSLSQQYLTLTFNVEESDGPSMSDLEFPTFRLYENQFSDDGLLRLPSVGRAFAGAATDSFGVYSAVRSGSKVSAYASDLEMRKYGLRDDGTGLVPVLNPTLKLFYSPDSDRSFLLCSFVHCVFGTPQFNVNPSGVAPMGWTQQIGFRFIKWERPSYGNAVAPVPLADSALGGEIV